MAPAGATVRQCVLDLIGNTPTIELVQLRLPPGKRLYLKLECFNPTFSIKDRTAYGMIQAALRSGALAPGGTVIESTSGNLGKSLAMIGAVLGLTVVIVVDPKVTANNLAFYRAFGAQVVVVDRPDEIGGYQVARIARVKALLAQTPGAYWPNQYDNADNPDYHDEHTAREVLDDGPSFDTLVGSISTGGHLCGIARRVKRERPAVRTVACDAAGSAVFGGTFAPYLLNGIGLSWRSANADLSLFDACYTVSDEEAFSTARAVARHAGLLLGGSSGAVIFAALAELHHGPATSALAVMPDSGTNYLSQFYDDRWLAERGLRLIPAGEVVAAAARCRPVR